MSYTFSITKCLIFVNVPISLSMFQIDNLLDSRLIFQINRVVNSAIITPNIDRRFYF